MQAAWTKEWMKPHQFVCWRLIWTTKAARTWSRPRRRRSTELVCADGRYYTYIHIYIYIYVLGGQEVDSRQSLNISPYISIHLHTSRYISLPMHIYLDVSRNLDAGGQEVKSAQGTIMCGEDPNLPPEQQVRTLWLLVRCFDAINLLINTLLLFLWFSLVGCDWLAN